MYIKIRKRKRNDGNVWLMWEKRGDTQLDTSSGLKAMTNGPFGRYEKLHFIKILLHQKYLHLT